MTDTGTSEEGGIRDTQARAKAHTLFLLRQTLTEDEGTQQVVYDNGLSMDALTVDITDDTTEIDGARNVIHKAK